MTDFSSFPLLLLQWYREHARTLPWRSHPTAYHVWISEIMLQQTRVAAVLGYYERFLQAAPTVEQLAALPEDQLMKLWQGLGYYSRARNLQKAAKEIVDHHGGQFPNTYDAIRALPGIGDYTAGAISSIAFGLPVPAVDGNVLRVMTRVWCDEGDITKQATKQRITQALAELIPVAAPGEFNQALMELGAMVCLPNGAPLCDQCPVRDLCQAHLQERTDQFPVKPSKKPRRIEQRTVFLFFHENKVALRRRPSKGLLAGLWEFPNELSGEIPSSWALSPTAVTFSAVGKHIFSHIEWHMTALSAPLDSPTLPEGWVWASREELHTYYAVPNAFSFVWDAVWQQLGYF